jgi:hypothetical protein
MKQTKNKYQEPVKTKRPRVRDQTSASSKADAPVGPTIMQRRATTLQKTINAEEERKKLALSKLDNIQVRPKVKFTITQDKLLLEGLNTEVSAEYWLLNARFSLSVSANKREVAPQTQDA